MNLSSHFPASLRAITCSAFVFSVALAPGLFAQEKIEFPDASQHSIVKQRVGLTEVEVEYSRPNVRGRQIFGGLVPYGKVWRTGANASTKIKFSDAVKIGGKDVAAGEYAFYTLPTESEWTIILSKDTKGWGAYDYKSDTDALRVMVKPIALTDSVESFTISFDNLKSDGATIALVWDKTRVPVELTTNTLDKVSANIEGALKKPDSLDQRFYYQAASFYYDNDKDLAQALKWIDQAIEKKQPAGYFLYQKKAQIAAKLGQKDEARAAAEKSIELLKAEKEPDESAIATSQKIIDDLR